jgi:hypothetical protein
MKRMVIIIAAFFAVIVPANAQAPGLKAALSACMMRAVVEPLPMVSMDDPAALMYACEGQPALALFTAMELVSNQTIENDLITRRAGAVVCSRHRTHQLMICTLTVQATAPFMEQAR